MVSIMYGTGGMYGGILQPVGSTPRGVKLDSQATGLFSCLINPEAVIRDRKSDPAYMGPYEGPDQLNILAGDPVIVPRNIKSTVPYGFSVFNGTMNYGEGGTNLGEKIFMFQKEYKFVGFATDPYMFSARALAPTGVDTQIKGITNFYNYSGEDIGAGELLTWIPDHLIDSYLKDYPHKRQRTTYRSSATRVAIVPLKHYTPIKVFETAQKGTAHLAALKAATNVETVGAAVKGLSDLLYDDESIFISAAIGWSPTIVKDGTYGQIVLF